MKQIQYTLLTVQKSGLPGTIGKVINVRNPGGNLNENEDLVGSSIEDSLDELGAHLWSISAVIENASESYIYFILEQKVDL